MIHTNQFSELCLQRVTTIYAWSLYTDGHMNNYTH